MSTLYRIACAPTQKPYRIGLLFTQGSLISARFLQRSDAAPLRSWKWIVTYRIGLGRFCSHYAEVFFMSARKAIRYSVDIALAFMKSINHDQTWWQKSHEMFARKLLKNSVAAMIQLFRVSQQLISRSFPFREMATESYRPLYLSCRVTWVPLLH